MAIIDSQVHVYEANTPKRPWHSVPNWPDHVTGDEMVAAIDRLPLIQRQHCRDSFESRFTVQRMVQDYLALYERMAAAARPRMHINGRASGLLHGRQITATELVTPHGTA